MKKIDFRPLSITLIALLLSIFGHSFYIYRFFKDGTIFTGPNDGLEQMLPMQLYLYEKFSSGQFFYSLDFGLGGDYYTDLSYYYSTSIIFFINMIAVKFLDLFFTFNVDTVTFWAKNAFFISIAKSTAGITLSYYYFRKIKMDALPALLSGFLFLTSAIYFRFTLYWSFFSDVFIFLPLLLLGIERYIQQEKKEIFIIATACIFINNFYFAYYQVLFGIIYFLLRNIFKSDHDQVNRLKQWINFFIMSLLGLMISSFAFFYGAKSFIQNERAPYREKIPLFDPMDQNANIFYDNYLVIVLFITLQALLTFKFYKHYFYRFFAVMSIALMLLSFTPFIDSVFNGFSAPQKRWHYLITFFTSGLIGFYIMKFKEISIQNYLYSIIPGFVIVWMSHHYIHKDVTWVYFLPVITILGLVILIVKQRKLQQTLIYLYIVILMIFNWDVVRVHNKLDNYNPGIDSRAKLSYIESSVYDSPLQRQIIDDLKKQLNPGERIDWRVLEQDNTPMYQNFNGVSLYSSIFDGSYIDFYYKQLKINIKEESLSRYSTFNGRSNLESLFNVKYLVRKSYQTDIPSNFKLIRDYGKYKVYENTKMIPFARITNHIFNQDDLQTPIDRERAMINGIVTEALPTNETIHPANNLLKDVKVTASGAHWLENNKTLKVNPPSGGIVIEIPQKYLKQYKDFYLEMFVSLQSPITNYQINVNNYANNRLFQTSKYRTHYDDLMYRVKTPKNGKILIGLTPGTYQLNIRGLYGEDYKMLNQVKNDIPYRFSDNGNKMTVHLGKSREGYLTVPIIYRDGMNAYVDGKKTEVIRANYLMSAVKVTKDTKTVTFKYIPPYFYLMLVISILGIILSYFYIRYAHPERKKKNVQKQKEAELWV
ncbi:YfhO family protein [Macrococcoides caseolyticum]|uniref:YfhO family protein n=1 Tax=Macrococcoides caseolyticum TaxID=69966 RepID=UPI001F47AAB2|nr:YfhO family protein [Macrococcus caseolyticus]MCE4956766.1 YfhO family protein [Macrococcus caseolyticus]